MENYFCDLIQAGKGFGTPYFIMSRSTSHYHLRTRVGRTKTTRCPELASHAQDRPESGDGSDPLDAATVDTPVVTVTNSGGSAGTPGAGNANDLNHHTSNFSLVDGTYKFYNFNKCKLNECKVHCRNNNLILPLNHVKSTVCNKNFSILTNSNLSCKSNNIVYLITCSVCKIQYVGETGRNFDIRMSEHIKFIERKSKNMRIYQHFTNDEHFTDNNGNILPTNKRLRFQIIESIKSVNLSDGDARKLRLNRELYWISKMKTAYPLGLNEKIEGHGLFGNASDPSFTKYNLYKVVNDCEIKKKKKNRCKNKKKGNINDE